MSRLFSNQFDAVTVAPSASINNLQTYTAMAWVLANTWGGDPYGSGGEGVIFSKDSEFVDNIQLELGNSNGVDEPGNETFFALAGIQTDDVGYSFAVDYTLSLGQWVHLAMVVSLNAPIRLYKNGIEQAYQGQAAPTSFGDDSASPWVVGNYLDGSFDYNFVGYIAEVRLYNSVLSPAQIHSAMIGGGPAPSSLVVYLPFSSNLGSTEPDASGHGNAGVISGAVFSTNQPPPFGPPAPLPLPLPFSRRTTAAVSVFACLTIAAPQQYATPAFGASQFTMDPLTIAALQLEYAQLLHEYHRLRHQDTANNAADLDAAVNAATITVRNLKATVDGLVASGDGALVLAKMQNITAQALASLQAVQIEE